MREIPDGGRQKIGGAKSIPARRAHVSGSGFDDEISWSVWSDASARFTTTPLAGWTACGHRQQSRKPTLHGIPHTHDWSWFGPFETTSCHSRQAIAHGSMASIDRNGRARFDGQMTVSAVICAKTLSFLGLIPVLRLTLAISTLCSPVTRPWIETRFPWVSRSSA